MSSFIPGFVRTMLFLLFVAKSLVSLAAGPLERIKVDTQKHGFVMAESGKPFRVWGVNYDHDDSGRLIEDYWMNEWDRVVEDFGEIKAMGVNVVRIHLQFAKFMDSADQPNQGQLERLTKLIQLAEETGLYLDLTGLGCYHKADVPAWYDQMDEAERWEAQANFWQAIARVAKGHAAIFCYDLMNEPVLAGEKSENDWLVGELEGKTFVQRITREMKGRTRIEVAKAWVDKLCTVIRREDPETLLTVGVIPWAQVFPGAKPIFYAPEVHGPLDFASIHLYPKGDEIEPSLKAMQVYAVGKPLVIEEIFPLSASIETTWAFMQAADPHVAGFVSFYWGATEAENRAKNTLPGALTAAWLARWSKKVSDTFLVK